MGLYLSLIESVNWFLKIDLGALIEHYKLIHYIFENVISTEKQGKKEVQ